MQALVFLFTLLLCARPEIRWSDSAYAEPPPPGASVKTCINDVCGPPSQSNTYMTQFQDRLDAYIKFYSANPNEIEFPHEIKKIFSEIQQIGLDQGTYMKMQFKNVDTASDQGLEGPLKAFYNLVYATPYVNKLKYKTLSTKGQNQVVVDETASEAELKTLTEKNRKWVYQVGNYLAASQKGALSQQTIRATPPAVILKHLYPGKTLVESMELEYRRAQNAIASVKDNSPLEKQLYFGSLSQDQIGLIGSHIMSGTVDENETRALLLWNQDFIRNRAYFNGSENPLLTRETPSTEDIIHAAGGDDAVIQKFEQFLNADQTKERGRERSCQLRYFINTGLLPTKDQVERLEEDIKRSKQLVRAMVKEKFPPSIQTEVNDAIDKMTFIKPPTVQEFEQNLKKVLQQKLAFEKDNLAGFKKMSPADLRKAVAAISTMDQSGRNSEASDDKNPLCDAFQYLPMTDGNYTTYGSTILSYTTATGAEESRMKTIMHEIGHTVSNVISSNSQNTERFTNVRKCLEEQHSEELPPRTKNQHNQALAANPKVDGVYTEEDFADSVSGESGKNVYKKNPWCQFLTLSKDRQSYEEFSLQANDDETHSSSLFRLLNFEMMRKDRLPNSCGLYFESVKFTDRFRSCLDLATTQEVSKPKPAEAIQ